MATTDQPPAPDSFTHVIDLTSTTDSKISAVSVYSSRAEITRIFHAQLKTGQNRVNISGLPNVLYDDSVRLEGRGPATIHDVSTTTSPQPGKQSTSPEMDDLVSREERTLKELERCKTLHEAVGKYLATLHVEHVDVEDLDKIVDGYKATCGKLDNDILDLEKRLKAIDEDIQKETEKETEKQSDKSWYLQKKVSLSLFAERESEVELILTYAVSAAYWSALYELRVDMEAKETPITLVYKAAITQNTAEEWKDVPIRLETATPTFGIELPSLSPWTLSIFHPPPPAPPQRAVVQARRESRTRMRYRCVPSNLLSMIWGTLSFRLGQRDVHSEELGCLLSIILQRPLFRYMR
ncbi:hypothetical protein APHAL10511_000550 [Amanita phalloides]|nr:hypothetical protein APHAL10511_000550 [Amanita phalloides]